MGEAKQKTGNQAERFQEGVLEIGGHGYMLLLRDGRVHKVHVTRGARVHDQEVIRRAHEAARQAGRSSSRIIRGGSQIIRPGA